MSDQSLVQIRDELLLIPAAVLITAIAAALVTVDALIVAHLLREFAKTSRTNGGFHWLASCARRKEKK